MCSKQLKSGESMGRKQCKILFSVVMAHKVNLLKGRGMEILGVAGSKNPFYTVWIPSDAGRTEAGELQK